MQEILVICKEHGYIQPTVFQGAYNLIDRAFETAIIPLLRQHRIRLAAHSPLAGGYLTGKMLPRSQQSSPSEILSHFDPSWGPSSYYTKRYLPMAPALAELQAFVAERGLTLREVAYRWLQYHSAMAPEDHGLVVGASSLEQLESTILDCKKGPLPDTVSRNSPRIHGSLDSRVHLPCGRIGILCSNQCLLTFIGLVQLGTC
ncbi:uncharacterized protein PHACADRAFT_265964 [Phanerochaete carnosa HHB-10118-sp]|uniref:NADP-dependent oxidoreductase domain-containing protein n=1 Tax=Phanerochaete carnosa (strain HHB-10118-sp) TaxID=650164 RepID=K5WFI6_PHACS|nr:uncharacterized protein PHACADRAFT_265964 [Phanerochaete carnosa HHB-10118-sp]EKM48942.1 hypothetical protein PHACADRAFT_265964 [Phanerochaete carnosa HHB-10118-sp]